MPGHELPNATVERVLPRQISESKILRKNSTVEPHTTRIRNFRGIPCIAGRSHIYLANDGSFRRCVFDQERVLDRPLDSAEPCGVSASKGWSDRVCGRSSAASRSDRNASSAAS